MITTYSITFKFIVKGDYFISSSQITASGGQQISWSLSTMVNKPVRLSDGMVDFMGLQILFL